MEADVVSISKRSRLLKVLGIILFVSIIAIGVFKYVQSVNGLVPLDVTINQASTQTDPTGSTTVKFTAVFSQAIDVSSLDSSDVILTGSAPGKTVSGVVEVAPNDDTTFEITATTTGLGTVVADIPAASFSSPSSSVFATAGFRPVSITRDSSGNIYTTNESDNNVTKITPAGVSSILGTTGSSPLGITIDSSGNVYTANFTSSNVTKITPAGVSSTLGTTGTNPRKIAIDSGGNVYTSNYNSDNVTKITPAGVSSILGTTGSKPYGITIDSGGNIYTANYSGSNVTKITPAGGLSFVMQIALSVGVVFALPLILFQIAEFARPALKPIKSRYIAVVLIFSFILTIAAVVYAYIVSLPAALNFLTTFNSDGVKALISVNDYLRFLFAYILGTVLAFQIPLVLFFANKIRRFPPGGLLKMQRPALVGSIVFAGVITPTIDPINQLLVAVPIIALFEVGATAVFISNRLKPAVGKFEIKMPSIQAVPVVLQTSVSADAQPASLNQAKKRVIDPMFNSPARSIQAKRSPLIMDVFAPSLN